MASYSNLNTCLVILSTSDDVPCCMLWTIPVQPFLMEADILLRFNVYVRDSIPIYELAFDTRRYTCPARPLVVRAVLQTPVSSWAIWCPDLRSKLAASWSALTDLVFGMQPRRSDVLVCPGMG